MKKGWENKTLQDVCINLDSKRVPITKNKRLNGDFPYYGASGIVDYVAEYIFDGEFLLVSEDGANLLARTYPIAFSVSGKFWVNNHAHILQFDNMYTQKYVENYLNSIKLDDYISGMAQPKLNQAKLNSIIIPLATLSEQQQIVEKLDQAFEMIDQAKANIEQNIINAKELFQSKLDEVFSQKDEGWQNEKLGFIGKPTMCKRIFKDETSNVGDIPFYKIGTFGKKPDAYISKELYENYKEKYSYPKKGDVLISASGTIGRRVVFDGNPAYFQDSNIVWIDNDESIITNRYLYHFYGYCKWTTTTGATIARLYNNNLRDIDITFPTKINDQDLVVKFIDEFQENTNRLLIRYQQKLDNLEELRKSILEKAFRGELTK